MSNTQRSLSPSVVSTLCSLRPPLTPTHVLHPPLWSCMAQTHLHMQEYPHGFTHTHTYTQNVICATAAVFALPTYRSCDSPRRNCDPGVLHCLKLSLLLSCAAFPFHFEKKGSQWRGTRGKKDPSEKCWNGPLSLARGLCAWKAGHKCPKYSPNAQEGIRFYTLIC